MGLIGSAIGGVAGIAGGILAGNELDSGYRGMQNMYAQQQAMFDKRMDEVKAHRDAVYYQDPNASAANQAAVTNAQKVMAEQNKRSHARNIVTGGTDESEAIAKKQATDAVGQMLQQQATQHEQQKEQAYNNADQQINTFTKYKADAIAGAAQAKA